MPKRGSDADSRIFFDELVSVGVSRLKASGAVKLEDRQAVIPFGEQNKLIGVAHTIFWNGGSWSYIRCPKCGARSKKLWLVDDASRCRLCLEKLGVRYRAAYGFGRTERLRERDRRAWLSLINSPLLAAEDQEKLDSVVKSAHVLQECDRDGSQAARHRHAKVHLECGRNSHGDSRLDQRITSTFLPLRKRLASNGHWTTSRPFGERHYAHCRR